MTLVTFGGHHAVQDGASLFAPQYKNALDAARTVLRQEGWRSFYKGLTPALIGSGRCNAWREGCQEGVLPALPCGCALGIPSGALSQEPTW